MMQSQQRHRLIPQEALELGRSFRNVPSLGKGAEPLYASSLSPLNASSLWYDLERQLPSVLGRQFLEMNLTISHQPATLLAVGRVTILFLKRESQQCLTASTTNDYFKMVALRI